MPTRNLNIRANTSPATLGSVIFNLSGKQIKNQTESSPPYALFGDNSGDYNNWTPAVGSFTLKGTPYSASGGSGTAGTALTVAFSVIDQATVAMQRKAKTVQEHVITQSALTVVKVYPNPVDKSRFMVLLPEKFEREVSFTLLSLLGTKLYIGKHSLKKSERMLTFDFSKEMIASGLYYLLLESKGQKAFAKLWQGN